MATGDKLMTFDMGKELNTKFDNAVGNLKSAIGDMQESTDNIFYLTNAHQNWNGVTIDLQPDGSYLFNGTATGNMYVGVMGTSGSDPAVCLSDGTYSFGWDKLSGSCTVSNQNDFSLRAGGTASANTQVRSNKNKQENTVISSGNGQCTIYIKAGVVLTKYKVRLWINSGSTLKNFIPNKVVYDFTSRGKTTKNTEDITTLNGSFSKFVGEVQGTTDNLLYMSSDYNNYNGITVDLQPDGTYLCNGTATGTTKFAMLGASSWSENILPAGTYSFGWQKVSGSCTVSEDTDFSIHIGEDSKQGALIHDQSASATATFDSATICMMYIKEGTELNNYRLKLWGRTGSTLGRFIPHKTAIDYSSRYVIDGYIGSSVIASVNTQKYPIKIGERSVRGQGGTLIKDGVFAFIRNAATGQTTADIHYIETLTGTAWGRSSSASGLTRENVGHANDMCYNPDDDCIYVATMLENGAIAKLTNSMLAVYDSAIYPVDGNGNTFESYSIAYNRQTKEYMLNAGNYTIHVFNNSWEYVRTITLDHWTYEFTAAQGMETDGTYLYLMIEGTNGNKYTSVVLTYEMDGTLVEEYNLRCFSDSDEYIETEGIAYDWINGTFYMNCNIHAFENYERVYAIVPNNMNYHCVGLTSIMINRWMNGASF